MRAAQISIEYERPALKATAVVYGGDFARKLELAIKRAEPALIEAKPSEEAEREE